MLPPHFLYLASKSPRRHELLKQMNLPHQCLSDLGATLEVDEQVLAGEHFSDYLGRITLAKLAVGVEFTTRQQLPSAPVLAADTIVELNQLIIGKPENERAARTTLQRLSGREHAVHTAIAIHYQGAEQLLIHSNKVRFRQLSDELINNYIASGDAMDKAGAYGIQGMAGVFVEHIEGSYSSIMGLPICQTLQLLETLSESNQTNGYYS